MRASDKLFIGVPALIGGIPVVAKMIPAAFALAIVFGFRGGRIDTGSIITGLTGLVVLGAYLFRQWDKFRTRRIMFSKELSENLYFRNLDNNEGVLTRLVDEAEEEECKEALLAYFFLHRSADGMTAEELDATVEGWFRERFRAEVDFDVSDALDKLAAFGLIEHEGERARACSLDAARARLDERWDGLVDR